MSKVHYQDGWLVGAWLWIWCCEFARLVYRRDNYFLQPAARRSIKYTASVAKIISDTLYPPKAGE